MSTSSALKVEAIRYTAVYRPTSNTTTTRKFYPSDILLERLTKTIIMVSQNSRSPGRTLDLPNNKLEC